MDPRRPLRRARAVLRPHAPTILVAGLVAWASWPVTGNLQPLADLDGAWNIALQQALHDGLDFGPDLVSTYGPLGFLREPLLVYPWPARLAFGYGVLVHYALCATLVVGLRRTLGSLPAAAFAALLLAAVIVQEPTLVIGFTACVALAAGLTGSGAARVLAAGLGALVGIELLSKINTGITLALLGVVAVATAPAPRRALAASVAGGSALALAVGWFATGQSLGAADDYVRGSLAIVSGYSEAMHYDEPAKAWEYWTALVVAVIGFVVARHAGTALPRRSRTGLLLLWALLVFTSFKTGFVRHDLGHANIFWASMLGGLIAFSWAPHRRSTAVLLGALVLVALFASLSVNPASFVAPLDRAERLVDQALTLTDGSATNEGIARARDARLATEALDPVIMETARGRAVHVDPVDAGLPWAQRLPWNPLPVFQTYSAYTAFLDDRNAAALRGPNAPPLLIRELGQHLDGRNPAWESPAAMREMLCHYRAIESGPRWQLLERTPPRCGGERPLASIKVALWTPAPIPPAPDASSMVFARIDGIEVGGLERLRTMFYRAAPRSVVFDGERTVRLIPGTAANGLVLRVPRRADFPAPFAFDQGADTMTVTRGSGPQDGEVRLRFFALPIR